METEQRKVDWEQIKRCISKIDSISKEFLYQALLIGGAAAWVYRNRLIQAKDPDFVVDTTNRENELQWLSRDIDFTGIFPPEAFTLLPANVVRSEGPPHIEVEGVRLGFAQVGVSIDPREAIHFAETMKIRHDDREIQFLIADSLTLYFEKDHLRTKRGHANDHLHAKLLFDYTAYSLVRGAERILRREALVSEASSILGLWIRTKDRAPELLRDHRVMSRLSSLTSDNPSHLITQCLRGIE